MALKKFKPKTSSTRFKVNLDNNRLVKNKIEKKLLCALNKSGGRKHISLGKVGNLNVGALAPPPYSLSRRIETLCSWYWNNVQYCR